MEIPASTLTAAALLTQFLLAIIVFTGIAITGVSDERFSRPLLPWIAIIAFLPTIGALIFSRDMVVIWEPAFGKGFRISYAVPTWFALILMFTVDSICTFLLVLVTRGGLVSPFSPVFFTLPALALFLREPGARLLYYVSLVFVLFSVAVYFRADDERWIDRDEARHAYWTVSVACFLLTTLIGWLTRSQ